LEIKRSILVIGGGISGIQAALDLAEQGNYVYLVENKPSIGGHMAKLDKTFPTNDCSICILAPKMVECSRHPNIKLFTYSEIIKSERIDNGFKVIIWKKERYVNEEKCTGCRLCSDICPVKTPNEFDCGLRLRSAIYIPFAQAVPNIAVLDKNLCIQCRSCIKTCPANAIEFDNPPNGKKIEILVSSIIIATGFELFDPTPIKRYNYDKLKNVITSLEYERILCASGPTGGKIVRLSDGNAVKSIVLIHCVGSRSIRYNEYCSQVCCMYATKQAIITKEHNPNIDIKILYNDIRAYGKGFQEYIERAKSEHKIEYIKSYPSLIEEDPDSNKIEVYYEDIVKNKIAKINTDLVILCTTMIPSRSIKKLSEIFGIQLNEFGFFKQNIASSPVETSQKNIFIVGTCEFPKDIPESIAEASASAALACYSGKYVQKKKDIHPQLNLDNELRIGVFICHCGTNIGGIVNVNEVLEDIKKVPDVVYATTNLYTCSSDTQELIKKAINEYKLNRVIVASCTPRTHELLFRNTCKEAGLNQYLFEFANIREQCSWVHMNEPEKATEKSKDLIKMAIARARFLRPQEEIEISIKPSALVIGGGVSGIVAANTILSKGYKVYLIEKKDKLGGYLNKIYRVNNNLIDPQEILKDLIGNMMNNPNFNLYLKSEIDEIKGSIGEFYVKIRNNGEEIQLNPGVIIVAIGAQEFIPIGYFNYGTTQKIITQTEFHKKLKSENFLQEIKSKGIKKIAFIQCTGSRLSEGEGKTYCSKICCSNTLRLIKVLKNKFPEVETYVYYRDISIYGKDEILYRNVRALGTTFIRYDKEFPPKIEEKNNRLEIKSKLFTINQDISLNVDMIILATPLVPTDDAEKLSKLLKVPLSYNGFFLEAHVKHRPLDFATDGIYLCGTCQSPKSIKESISQGIGAASRALIPLMKGKVKSEPIYAVIDENLCVNCEICKLICPFNAISIEELSENELRAKVNPILCKGCGACASACPIGAITMKHYTDKQIISMIQKGTEKKDDDMPKIIAFLCNWCAYAGADNAGVSRFQYSTNIRPIRVMCSARISIKHILEAFKAGADGVLVSGCHLGDCHYISGNFQTQRRVKMAKILLQYIGINPDRLQLSWCSASEGNLFAQIVNEFTEKIKRINESESSEIKFEVLQ